MRVLVTGGLGFIGRALALELARRGHEVWALDLPRTQPGSGRWPPAPPGVALAWLGDVRDRLLVRRAVEGVQVIYHLAAVASVQEAQVDPAGALDVNVGGTFTVLREARRVGVRRVVLASSREVYGDPLELPAHESAPLLPANAYGRSKVAAEALLHGWGPGPERLLEVQALRLTNIYGPGDVEHPGRVVPRFLARAQAGLPLELYGGEQVVDLLPLSVAVEAFVRAGVEGAGDGSPINVGSGRGVSLVALARAITALVGSASEVERVPARPGEVRRFIADVGRMETLLGVKAPADPLEALPELLRP